MPAPKAGSELQALRGSDAEEVHALPEGLAGELAQQQPGFHDLLGRRLEDGAVLVEGGVGRCQVVQVGAEAVGFERFADDVDGGAEFVEEKAEGALSRFQGQALVRGRGYTFGGLAEDGLDAGVGVLEVGPGVAVEETMRSVSKT